MQRSHTAAAGSAVAWRQQRSQPMIHGARHGRQGILEVMKGEESPRPRWHRCADRAAATRERASASAASCHRAPVVCFFDVVCPRATLLPLGWGTLHRYRAQRHARRGGLGQRRVFEVYRGRGREPVVCCVPTPLVDRLS